jgi:hypothetical protein
MTRSGGGLIGSPTMKKRYLGTALFILVALLLLLRMADVL